MFAPFTVFKALGSTAGLIGEIPTTWQRVQGLVEAGVIGGTYNVTYDYVRNALDGKIPNAQEVLESYKDGALFGAYFHVGGEAISEAAPFIKNAFSKASSELSDNMKALKYAWDNVEVPKDIKLGSNGGNIDLRAGKDFVKKYNEALEDIKNGSEVGSNPKIELGKEDLDALRKKWNVQEINTIAVGKTDVQGLEDVTFEGGSPAVRKEAGFENYDISNPNRAIKSSGKIPSATRHAEEVAANEFVEAVEKAGIKPEDVVGTLRIHQSNTSGVCPTCLSGLGNPNKASGVIKQLSLKYPNLVIEVTSETAEGAKINGRLAFKVKNGSYID